MLVSLVFFVLAGITGILCNSATLPSPPDQSLVSQSVAPVQLCFVQAEYCWCLTGQAFSPLLVFYSVRWLCILNTGVAQSPHS